ncbi:MAG: hypothetical protein AAB522_00040, partial [Patescibacteria group bacterium]
TPMYYFIAHTKNAGGGAMIPASHLPIEYNGIKLLKKGGEAISEGSGLEEIRNSALRGIFLDKERGTVTTENFKKVYLNFFKNKFPDLKDYEIKINADLENSVVATIFEDLIKRFPKFKISSKKYDFGVSFDKDGDRIKFKDENGNEIAGDIIIALLIQSFKEDFKNNFSGQGNADTSTRTSFIYSINSSRVVKEEIEKYGGCAVESRVGHAFIKKAMRENDAVFGGELSGHYYFKDFFYCDSALFAMFCVIDLLKQEKKTLSELIKPLLRYSATPELNFDVKNKDKYIDKAAAAFGDAQISYKDGIKVDYSNWWFLLRPSNTEDVIRLRVEASTPKLLEEKKKQVLTTLGF